MDEIRVIIGGGMEGFLVVDLYDIISFVRALMDNFEWHLCVLNDV